MVRKKNIIKIGVQFLVIFMIIISSSTVYANITRDNSADDDKDSLTDSNDDTFDQENTDTVDDNNHEDEESNDEVSNTDQNNHDTDDESINTNEENNDEEINTNNTQQISGIQKVFIGVVVVDDTPESNSSYEEIQGEPVVANIYVFKEQLAGGTFTKIGEITLTYLPYPNLFYGGKYLWWNNSGTLTVGYEPTNFINGYSVVEASIGNMVSVHHWKCKIGVISGGGNVEDEIKIEFLDLPNLIAYFEDLNVANVDNKPPVARFTYSPLTPLPKTDVTFNGSSSYDPDGEILYYFWAYRPANTSIFPIMMNNRTNQPIITYKWDKAGNYEVTLVVIDDHNNTDRMTQIIRIPYAPSIFSVLSSSIQSRFLKRIN